MADPTTCMEAAEYKWSRLAARDTPSRPPGVLPGKSRYAHGRLAVPRPTARVAQGRQCGPTCSETPRDRRFVVGREHARRREAYRDDIALRRGCACLPAPLYVLPRRPC